MYLCIDCQNQPRINETDLELIVQSYGVLVSDVHSTHGGKQMITTPNGIMILINFKSGLPYLEHCYPTDKQMREII